MNFIKTITYILLKQILNVVRLFIGKPLVYPSLGSMTLDKDDVLVAKKWLKNRSTWNDNQIVEELETKFSNWNGSKYAFAFMGGRIALSAIIHGLGLKPKDEVIIPGYTCVVVPNAFEFAGIKPVYCDIELDTYGLDVSLIESKITSKTKAIMLHHLYGLVCRDFDAILKIAEKHKLKVIEDCAHATGAEYKGIKVGNYGHAAFYSFEQSKIINTVQGGMAVTNDKTIAAGIQKYYDNALLPETHRIDNQLHTLILNYYQFKHSKRWILGDIFNLFYGRKRLISTTNEEECGICPEHYGRKMSAPVAAIGLNQLQKIDNYNTHRRQAAKKWDTWCDNAGYKKPLTIKDSVPVFLRYPVLVEPDKKQDRFWALNGLHVDLGVWFVSNIHPVNTKVENCPNANTAVKECINFPCLL